MIPTTMILAGKRDEKDVTAAGTGMPTAVAPSSPAPTPRATPRPKLASMPLTKPRPEPAVPPARSPATAAAGYTDRPGVDSAADQVLPTPIIPKF